MGDEGCTGSVVAVGLPAGAELAVDLVSWEAQAGFGGVGRVPGGVHVVAWAAQAGGAAQRTAEFVVLKPGDVVARRWDAAAEDLVPHGGGGGEKARVAAYPGAHRRVWAALAGHVTGEVLATCGIPVGTKVAAGDPDAAAGGAALDAVVPFHPGTPRAPAFAPLGRGDGGAQTPAEVTADAMDGSRHLRTVLASRWGGSHARLLGELQLAFVVFIAVGSYGAFEAWKAQLRLLATCGVLAREEPALFDGLSETLSAQLERVPEDFFVDELSAENFLRPVLARLVRTLELAGDDALRRRASELRKALRRRFELELPAPGTPSDDDEDADPPVVVGYTLEGYLNEDGTDALLQRRVDVEGVAVDADHSDEDDEYGSPMDTATERMSWMLPPPVTEAAG